MPKVPLESTDPFAWPGRILGWPRTPSINQLSAEERQLVRSIEEGQSTPKVKVWDYPLGRQDILKRDTENMSVVRAYAFLHYSYIPVEKVPLPVYRETGPPIPDEVYDYVPIAHLPRDVEGGELPADDGEEDPF